MMEKKPDIDNKLLHAWLAGECTPRERRAVERWLAQSPENIELLEKLVKPDRASLDRFERNKVKAKVLEKISSGSREEAVHDENAAERASARSAPKTFDIRNRSKGLQAAWWLRAAAVMLVIATAGIAVWLHGGMDAPEEVVYREITSPARTITSVTLSDGTHVELNANSTLRYPAAFQDDVRAVYLQGEAFFSVASDTRRTYKVRSGQLTTTVLGTKFNVNYMPDLDRVDVDLVEGRVSVGTSGQNHEITPVTLEPDQWFSYSGTHNSMTVQKGVRKQILWRDGILEFEGKTLLEVAATLENWYGVEMIIEDPAAQDIKLTGTFQDVSLEHILETLSFVAGIEYRMEKNEDNDIDKVMLSFTP
jgi:ferric-dicitrate binding protein FerR (iron transport regulator)